MKNILDKQNIRLIDVLILAPTMLYIGFKYSDKMPRWASAFLVVTGIETFGYNGINYLKEKK